MRFAPSYRMNLMQMSCTGKSLIFVTTILKVAEVSGNNHIHPVKNNTIIHKALLLYSASKSIQTCNILNFLATGNAVAVA